MIEIYDKIKLEYSKNKISSIYITTIHGDYVYHFLNGNKFIGSKFFDFNEVYKLTKTDKLSLLNSMFCYDKSKKSETEISHYEYSRL